MGTYRIVRLRVPRARSAQTRNISIPVSGEGLTYVAGGGISNHTQLHGMKTTENFGDGDKHIHLSPRHARKLLSIYAEMEHTAQYAALEASEISYQATNATTTAQTAHNTLAQLTAQHKEVVARRRFTQAALSELNAKKQALTDAVSTLQSKVEAFKASEEITEASYQTGVKPFVDSYTSAMEAYQAAITKADEGKDGAEARINLLKKGNVEYYLAPTTNPPYLFNSWYSDILLRYSKPYTMVAEIEFKGATNGSHIVPYISGWSPFFPSIFGKGDGYKGIYVGRNSLKENPDAINELMFYARDSQGNLDGTRPIGELKVKWVCLYEGHLDNPPLTYMPSKSELEGVQPITLKFSESSMIVKNNKGIRTLRPILSHNGEDITAYSVATLGVIYRWRRQSPNGIDKKGKTDATWESQNVGRASISIDTTEVYDGTKFAVGVDKTSAEKIQNYIKTRK